MQCTENKEERYRDRNALESEKVILKSENLKYCGKKG